MSTWNNRTRGHSPEREPPERLAARTMAPRHGLSQGRHAQGGWEIEKGKYPGMKLTLRTDKVLHGQANLIDCWVAENLTMATLATRTTWYLSRTGEAREIAGYEPGALSRFHLLAYVADIERLAVLTCAPPRRRCWGSSCGCTLQAS